MKLFTRKISVKKALTSKFISSPKRKVKKALIPGYGKKGTGMLKDPKKTLYNKVYNAATVDSRKIGKIEKNTSSNQSESSPTLTYVGATLNKKLPKYITSVKIKVVGKKRLNAETNYPVSTDKQILNSYEQLKLIKNTPKSDPEILKYFDADEIRKNRLLDYILPHFEKGLLLYRLGKWDAAEKEWIKLIYLMPHAIDKLGIMYRKEKRFYDVVLINEEASKSKTIPYLYATNITSEDITKAVNNYEKHKSSDKSILKSEDFKGLKRK